MEYVIFISKQCHPLKIQLVFKILTKSYKATQKVHKFELKQLNHPNRKKKHFWGMFSCQECSLRVNFASDLVEHMKEEGHGQGRPVTCPSCKEMVPSCDIQGGNSIDQGLFRATFWLIFGPGFGIPFNRDFSSIVTLWELIHIHSVTVYKGQRKSVPKFFQKFDQSCPKHVP